MASKEEQAGFKKPPLPGLLAKILSMTIAAILLVVSLTFSLVVFSALGVVALLVWAYVWWKTRGLRKQLREQPLNTNESGRVIEGEVIRDSAHPDRTLR